MDEIGVNNINIEIERRKDNKIRRIFGKWFKRWILCGILEERRVRRIYNEISQKDDDNIWSVDNI